MVAFAFLGNTLFLTILVSMLSNTFSNISTNASAEIQFRRAVRTLEGVKADAIFAYQPPFNLVAVFVFLPLKFVVSPRWFHKIHVATVRLVNLPLLLLIAVAERRLLWPAPGSAAHNYSAEPAVKKWFWQKWQLSASRYMRSVFDEPPPDDVRDDITVDDEMTHHLIRRQFTWTNTGEMLTLSRRQKQTQDPKKQQNNDPPEQRKPSRRDSMFPGVRKKLRRSFTETEEDYDAMAKKLQDMEDSMNRMEAMLAQLVPDTQVGDMDESAIDDDPEYEESMEESGTLQETQGFATESSYKGP